MRVRHFLTFALLIATGFVASPASAQNNSNQNQSPTAQASKGVATARLALTRAQQDVQKVRDKTKGELLQKPQWAPVKIEYSKAEADVAAAKRAAMNAAHSKPEYQAMVKERDDADKVRQQANAVPQPGADDTTKVSDADLVTANNNYITAALKMKAIEKQVVTDDPALNDATARLDAAKAKMAQLDAEVDEALKNDQPYQQLQTAVTSAQQAVDQAEQQLTQARQQAAAAAASASQQRSSQHSSSSSSGRR